MRIYCKAGISLSAFLGPIRQPPLETGKAIVFIWLMSSLGFDRLNELDQVSQSVSCDAELEFEQSGSGL